MSKGEGYDGPPDCAAIVVNVEENSAKRYQWEVGYEESDRDGEVGAYEGGSEGSATHRRDAMISALGAALDMARDYSGATHINITARPYMRAQVWL